jgi:Domain of unknown function (DUF3644)
MAPYVSARRLVDNSISGMLAAIELYNKPRVTYRDEITVILLVNAWELALKAVLRKHRVSIFDKKKRGEPYRSIPLNDAIGKIAARNLWPLHIDGVAVATNVKALRHIEIGQSTCITQRVSALSYIHFCSRTF